MGQCFSTTEDTVVIDPAKILHINDITTPDGKYTFSDGIGTLISLFFVRFYGELGKMSQSLAKRVARRLDLKKVPSAYQVKKIKMCIN
jgi:hypothetical protein